MQPRFPISNKNKAGFTLVEILVSFTVLGLIMVGVAQMMNSALSATLMGYKHMDADTQARMVLDHMAFDISRMTKRADVDYYFKKNTTTLGTTPGNDQMAFYSESGGYYPGQTPQDNSDVSLVGYAIAPMLNGAYNKTSGTPQLVRLSKGLTWNGYNTSLPAMVFNPNPTSITSNTITTTNWAIANSLSQQTANNIAITSTSTAIDPDYQVIGDQVFRLEYCFLVQTSAAGVAFQSPASAYTTTKAYLYDSPWEINNQINVNGTPADSSPMGMKDVTAIVVSIAVLDTKSRAAISNTTLTTAASYLQDDGYSSQSTAFASLPVTLWKAKLASNKLGLPASVASQVRFYQRYCYLNHLQ